MVHTNSGVITHPSYGNSLGFRSPTFPTSIPSPDVEERPLSQDSVTPQDSIIQKLRDGDEATFASLIDQYYPTMVRVALQYVPTQAIAEEVTQETWLGFLESLHRFEGRCSIKTWLFRILTNQAKTRGTHERRFGPLPATDSGKDAPKSIENPGETPNPNQGSRDPDEEGFHTYDLHTPETCFLEKEGIALIESAIQALPPRLRQIIVLRDVEGWTSEDVCQFLHLSEGNQRVLLHRARGRVRKALATVFPLMQNRSHSKKGCNDPEPSHTVGQTEG